MEQVSFFNRDNVLENKLLFTAFVAQKIVKKF